MELLHAATRAVLEYVTVIDIHAHWVPVPYRKAIEQGDSDWFGVDAAVGEYDLTGMRMTAAERLEDMDQQGVDIQVISPQVGFYRYEADPEEGLALARACNDDIAELVRQHPDRFAGMGTIPMQDIASAIAELERATKELGLRGAMIGHHVSGHTYDEPEFLPLWEYVQESGAVIIFHQGYDNTHFQVGKYHLDNSIGNQAEHAMTYGLLVGAGVIDRYPGMKMVFTHGGGFIPLAVARMDKAAGHFIGDASTQYRPQFLAKPRYTGINAKAPSAYLTSFSYDACTYTPEALRFLIDMVGAERVMYGTDCPAPMLLTDGARWIKSLEVLTEDEKDMILYRNAAWLFDL
jgi:aminocarboxymuconate-semialdehyde decarboxylase